jgi:hypothetical protein
MNCRNFENFVLALARNRLIDARSREQSLLHAEVCDACASRLSEERALLAGVRAVAAELALQEAPAQLEPVLLSAFREQKAVKVTPVELPMPSPGPVRPGRQLQALAAAVLLLISLAAMLWLQQGWLKGQPKQAVSPSTPEPQAGSLPDVAVTEKNVTHQTAAANPQRRARRQPRASRPRDVEVVTEFFPLLEGDDLNALESGQIVRVELSGAAFLAAGLPIDAALADEPVKADVILGHDGQARAIRFVR